MRQFGFGGVRRTGLATSVLVLVGLVTAFSAQGRAATSAAGPEAEQSARATKVAEAVARTNLAGRMEAALGAGFGGVWFDSSGTRLHVGFTSHKSRHAAVAVAVGSGLAGSVAPTSVSSSWAQLKATQARVDRWLAHHSTRGRATTSLAADLNAVQVELAASLPATKRAAIDRRAAASAVPVRVKVLPDSRFGFASWAQCAKFLKSKAYCDPTLVSGVSIDDEKEVNGEGDCTAGPLAIRKSPGTEVERTETFLLTAGHCLEGEGAVGKKWYAIEKQGAPKGRKEIGKATAALIQEAKIGADVGVIKMEAEPWKALKDPPVAPGVAPWSAANETNPFPVINQAVPVKNGKSCFSGQRSGIQCGEILATGKVIPTAKGEWTEVFEVELKTGKGGQGDSGSPASTEGFYKNNSEVFVEGIIVGGPAVESEFAYGQPLSFLFTELNARKALNLELLRRANEKRHAGVGKFHSSLGYTTLSGAQATTHQFSAGSGFGAVSCSTATFDGLQVEKTTEEVTVTPSYSGCKDSFGRAVDITTGGATYTYHSSGNVDISGTIELKVTSGGVAVCTVTIPSQTDNGITYANEGTAQIKFTMNSTNVRNTTSGGFLNCGVSNGEHTAGTYTGTSIVSGESGGETATLRYE
jgi:hypothetical protein